MLFKTTNQSPKIPHFHPLIWALRSLSKVCLWATGAGGNLEPSLPFQPASATQGGYSATQVGYGLHMENTLSQTLVLSLSKNRCMQRNQPSMFSNLWLKWYLLETPLLQQQQRIIFHVPHVSAPVKQPPTPGLVGNNTFSSATSCPPAHHGWVWGCIITLFKHS